VGGECLTLSRIVRDISHDSHYESGKGHARLGQERTPGGRFFHHEKATSRILPHCQGSGVERGSGGADNYLGYTEQNPNGKMWEVVDYMTGSNQCDNGGPVACLHGHMFLEAPGHKPAPVGISWMSQGARTGKERALGDILVRRRARVSYGRVCIRSCGKNRERKTKRRDNLESNRSRLFSHLRPVKTFYRRRDRWVIKLELHILRTT
jgi:hypothetical protein